MTSKNVIRSKKHGCFAIRSSNAWGKYLQPVEDPDGVKLTKFERDGIKLIDDFPKVPSDLWSRIIGLYFYMCPPAEELSTSYHDNQLEVQICFLRDAETFSKWKVVVPKQVVSGVSVKSELNQCIDIETGEKYEQFPPPGWVHAGSSHSHNTMDAFFSSVDDKSELTVPGLHIVIGNIDHAKMEYSYRASIVLRKQRKDVELEQVVDIDPGLELEFHEGITDYIDTVITANEKLYSELGKLSDDTEIEIDTSDIESPSNKFFLGLRETNTELLDHIDDYGGSFSYDMELMSLAEDRFKQGMSVEDVIKNIEAAYNASLSKDDSSYNEYCGECNLQVQPDWDGCPNCNAVFVEE